MKKTLFISCIVFALTLTACGSPSAPTAIPTVVLQAQPEASNSGNTVSSVSASGEVVPVQHVQLSFPLTGVVKTVEVKAGDSVTAGQALVTLDTAVLEAQVKEAEANLAEAQAQVHYLKRVGTAQEHLDSAQADADRAQASLDSAKATLAQATLTAPFDGTIASVDISPAETVVPGQVVITLGDLSKFQIETTDLSERDVTNLKVGQSAKITAQALGKDFDGKVTDVSRISSTVGGDVVYKVTIELDAPPQGLMWGMSVNVQIATGN
ncbi:MAG TPA: efflux RND transporter periplasmic adaptor subunit [Anaerolineales bacterium]|jgi:RND family efflux transporter MFP subunit|nr:efflux RND transporter periplasmic adaptor subunit [Anaerolineales bacterium]